MLKVLFILPSTGYYRSSLSNPLGVLSIASCLKANGFEVKVYDRNVDNSGLAKLLASFAPDIVGVSVMSSLCLKDAEKVSKIVKKHGLPLVWGGQVPSMDSEICLKSGIPDYVMIGEGELTWLELATLMSAGKAFRGIKGMAYLDNGDVKANEKREFADLGTMPPIDWSLADPRNYYKKYFYSDKMLYLYSSKGCPCDCAFCANRKFHNCTHRKKPDAEVLDEIESLIKNYGMNAVYFTDELWRINVEDARKFCTLLKERDLDFVWGCDSRIGLYSREDFRMLYDAKCRWILFGVESGSQEMLKRINKGIDLDRVREDVRNCMDAGITPITPIIIGLPDETVEQLKETVRFALSLPSKLIPVSFLFPSPGSSFREELTARGLYKPPENLHELRHIVATETLKQNYSAVPSKDLRVIRCFFHWMGFVGKDAVNNDGAFAFAKQTISDMFSTITKKGLIYFFVGLLEAARDFFYILWHVVAYPGVRKKYGLYLKNKK